MMPWTGRVGAAVTVAALALAAIGCDPDLVEGDLAVDNRTDTELTIFVLGELPDGTVHASGKGTLRPRSARVIPGSNGCATHGLEARDPDGNVVATLPPLDPGEHDCAFTWVITEDDSYIDR